VNKSSPTLTNDEKKNNLLTTYCITYWYQTNELGPVKTSYKCGAQLNRSHKVWLWHNLWNQVAVLPQLTLNYISFLVGQRVALEGKHCKSVIYFTFQPTYPYSFMLLCSLLLHLSIPAASISRRISCAATLSIPWSHSPHVPRRKSKYSRKVSCSFDYSLNMILRHNADIIYY